MNNFFHYNNFNRKENSLEYVYANKQIVYSRAPVRYFDDLLDMLRGEPQLSSIKDDFKLTDWINLQQAGYFTALDIYFTFFVDDDRSANNSNKDVNSSVFAQCLRILNCHGFGSFQTVRSDVSASLCRVYDSIEDRLYVERYGNAAHPVSAFTSGLVKAAHDFNVIQKRTTDQSKTSAYTPANPETAQRESWYNGLSSVTQNRCQAEDGSFSEFLVNTTV